MRKIFTLAVLVLTTTILFAQREPGLKEGTIPKKKVLKKIDQYIRTGNIQIALGTIDAWFLNDAYDAEMAYIAAKLSDQLQAIDLANEYYTLIEENDNLTDFPDADFRYANNLRTLGQYKEAKKYYRSFLERKLNAVELEEEIKEAQEYIQACDDAMALKKAFPSMFSTPVRMNNIVNDEYNSSEFAPYLKGDTLFFTRYYYGRKLDTTAVGNAKFNVFTWKEGEAGLRSAVRSGGQNAHTTFLASDDNIYMFETSVVKGAAEGTEYTQIYYRKLNSNSISLEEKWGLRKPLPNTINLSNRNSTQPAVGIFNGGTTVLFFASDRSGGQGGMDIWQSVITEENGELKFAPPTNLEAINTKGRDATPFFHNRCQTLYFSTDGHPTLGGLDIYQALKNDHGWEGIETMGYPINSSFDDNYFYRDPSSTKVYFSSRRIDPADTLNKREFKGCCYDIYEAELIVDINLDIKAYCGSNLLADVQYTSDKVGSGIVTGTIPLEINQTYQFNIYKPGYSAADFSIQTDQLCEDYKFNEVHFLQKEKNYTLDIVGLGVNKEETLKDVVATMTNLATGEVQTVESPDGRGMQFDVLPAEIFELTVTSPDYFPLIDTITIGDKRTFCTIERKDTLRPDIPKLEEILPTTLYFENAIPRPAQISDYNYYRYLARHYLTYDELDPSYKAILTKYYREEGIDTIQMKSVEAKIDSFFINQEVENYQQLESFATSLPRVYKESISSYREYYNSYLALKPRYKMMLTKYYLEEEQDTLMAASVSARVDSFFIKQVEEGYDELNLYAESLITYLQFGRKASLVIRGAASPRASPAYNAALSKRRIESVRKFLEEYKGGILKPYVDDKTLDIVESPIGQLSVAKEIEQKMEKDFGWYDPISAELRRVVIEGIQDKK